MGRLRGKRALVTGGSSGIGAATAQLLGREGADVAVLSRADGTGVVAKRVDAEGTRGFEVRVDVGDRPALENAIDSAVQELGGLDVAVVAAAAAAFGRFDEIPAEDFDRCVEVTFGGAVDTIRAVLPHLERSSGNLVVLGSASDTVALALLSPYVAAKHALDGFLKSLRAEMRAAGSSVTISVVRPGPVDSPFWGHVTHPEGLTPPRFPRLLCYSTESVARAAVACGIQPRASVTVGGLTVLLQIAAAVARPLVERALAVGARVGRTRAEEELTPSALWEPAGEGGLEGGLHGRPSLLAALRLRSSRPRAGLAK